MKNENILKPALAFFMVIILVQCVSGALLFGVKLGFTPESVAGFYLGAEEKFMRPKTFAGLLEVTVPHLCAVGVVVFILGHLVPVFAREKKKLMNFVLCSCFASAAGDIFSGYLVCFVHPGFAYLKLFSFALFELSLTAVAFSLICACFGGFPWKARERVEQA